MRIARLDLIAFGPFTDRSLDLSAGDFGLHMICGPNEAGKSSALRALRQFLYGIETRSHDNFVHGYPSLRIGAVLADGAGEQFHLIRRKGNKDTLRGSDDSTPADPTVIKGLLAGVDQNEFSQRFGIDHQELVEGSRDILRGGGQLGGLLFAAGAGLADLNAVQSKLEEEADELFKPRGSNPKINACLKQLQVAAKKRKDAQLRPAEWSTHMRALRKAQADKADLEQSLAKQETEQNRLQRLHHAIPLIASRQDWLDKLKSVEDVPLLPDGFADQRHETVINLKTIESTLTDAQAELQRIDTEMAALEVSEATLNNSERIQSLHEELGAIRKASRDRPTLVAQRNQLEEEARQILDELGRDIPLDQAGKLRLTRSQRSRIADLGSQRHALGAKVEADMRRMDELKDETGRRTSELGDDTTLADTGPLRRAIRRVQRSGDVTERLAKAKSEMARLQVQTELDLKKLGLWSGSLGDLESLPVPSRETIERFDRQVAELDGGVKNVQQRIAELEDELHNLGSQIERHRLSQDALTEDDLRRARQRRDSGWDLVLADWQSDSVDQAAVEAFLAENEPATELAQAYRSSVENADYVADRLRRESEQVAEKARLMTECQRREASLVDLRAQLAEKRKLRSDVDRQWCDVWSPMGLTPLSPREMLAWTSKQADLVREAKEIRERDAEVQEVEQVVRDCSQDLWREIDTLGRPTGELSVDSSLSDLLSFGEEVAEQLDQLAATRRQLEGDLRKLKKQSQDAQQRSEATKREFAEWQKNWTQAMATLDLPPHATPTEADDYGTGIDDLLARMRDAKKLRERIEGIDREVEQFSARVARCTTDVAADLAEDSPEQVVTALNERLKIASRAQANLEQLEKQRDQQEERLRDARSEMAKLTAALDALCSEAGCDTPDELPDIEQRSLRRRECESRLREAEEQLVPLSAGGALQSLLDEAATVDPDQLEPMIATLREELELQRSRRNEISEAVVREEFELRQMDGSDRAAEADEEAQGLLAQLRMDVEQFTRVHLASVILKQSIERYREKNQGPVLQRASQLFSALTLGSFAGLRDDYDEKGEPVLVGLRGDGRTVVGVGGMSEGTRDQLYLSLRLASLEHYLDQNDPIPFIVDDILIQFDDDRAAAALRVLAELSDRTQVIFFTHHEHLAQVAQDHIAPKGRLFVHRLTAERDAEPPPAATGGRA